MAPVFCRDFGLCRGLWMSLFHSVSAFCNAGIDLLGVRGAYSSLTSYAYDPLINLVIILLIVIGGIGFLTWDDIYRNRHHISRYRMQSKVIPLLLAGTDLYPGYPLLFLEFQDIPAGKRILVSLFQSVTTRTAGFNTADLFLHAGIRPAPYDPSHAGRRKSGIHRRRNQTTTLAVLISLRDCCLCQERTARKCLNGALSLILSPQRSRSFSCIQASVSCVCHDAQHSGKPASYTVSV